MLKWMNISLFLFFLARKVHNHLCGSWVDNRASPTKIKYWAYTVDIVSFLSLFTYFNVLIRKKEIENILSIRQIQKRVNNKKTLNYHNKLTFVPCQCKLRYCWETFSICERVQVVFVLLVVLLYKISFSNCLLLFIYSS